MTRHSWTALVSAVCFVVLVALVALVHVPFVAWGPGRTIDLLAEKSGQAAPVQVGGLKTYPVTGQLRMTTVSVTRVDSWLSLPEALWAWLRPNHDVLPREVIYPRDKSVDEVKADEVAQMDTSKSDAVVAALRAAKQPVTQLPMVASVTVSGPSYNHLQPGDLISRVDQVAVTTPQQVGTLVRRHAVGDRVVFSVIRNKKPMDVTVTTAASNQDKKVPVVGINASMGYVYNATVSYGIDPDVVGPSAGLVFSLAIYDTITPGDLVHGESVAGTGEISADGTVGAIGGIQEKIAGAQQAGATIFLVPAANCTDLAGVSTSMNLVKVAKLSDAINVLTTLRKNPNATVPHC